MRRVILLLLAASLLLAVACGQATPTPSPTPTSQPTPAPAATPTQTPTPWPTATATPAPSPTPTATATATPTPVPRLPLPDAPDRDLLDLARRLSLKSDADIPRVAGTNPANETVGSSRTFWVTDITRDRVYQTTAVLQHVSPHAYWYVEEGASVPLSDLRAAAAIFEQRIYPAVARAFGEPWAPGADGDLRITILHARIPGVAGYYSSTDEYPVQVHPFSNQRKMIFINLGAYPVSSDDYLGTLAHELQHAVHAVADPAEETWVNEGLSELASDMAGYPSGSSGAFLQSPATSLVHWPLDIRDTIRYYGAASLFMSYLAAHYGRQGDLRDLVRQPRHGIAGVDAFLRATGSSATFRDIFADWVIASLLDQASGRYSYPDRDVRVAPSALLEGFGTLPRSAPQYAADYVEVRPPAGDVVLAFAGDRETPLLPVEVPGGGACWWGNRGDSIDATLTGRFRLPAPGPVTLELTLWYDIEESWDYAYVEVSTDGGRTWDILGGGQTSRANPVGNSFGPGYTGRSAGWVRDTVDLTAYAGREVLLRIEHVTDESLHGDGPCIAEIGIPQMVWRDAGTPPPGFAWDARGFVRIANRVPQEYVVQVVEQRRDGPRVRRMTLDAHNRGELTVRGVGAEVQRLTVVVAAMAEKTAQAATYTLEARPTG